MENGAETQKISCGSRWRKTKMSNERIYLQLDIKDAKLKAIAAKVLKRWAVYDKATELWDITEHNHIVRYRFDKVLPGGSWEYKENKALFNI